MKLTKLWAKYLSLQSESEKQNFWLEYEKYLKENPKEIKNGFDTMLVHFKEIKNQIDKSEN